VSSDNLQDDLPHKPVLVQELLAVMESTSIRVAVDGTVGAGGHAAELLAHHPEIESYLGCDQDATAIALVQQRFVAEPRFRTHSVNFEALPSWLAEHGVSPQLILLDLGVSSMQLDRPERGFSIKGDGPLDMRMNQQQGIPASKLIASLSEVELADIFWRYGEEGRSRRIAKAIVQARRSQPIVTTAQLATIVEAALGRHGPTHPATKVFQALRIAVNDELGVLERSLTAMAQALDSGGILAIITFHSLEDRIVKWAFRALADSAQFRILTKKPLAPSREEVRCNRRARSAKLRALLKL